MAERQPFTLPFNVILVQDPNLKGYTAYFKQFPNVIAEGKDEKEAMANLFDALYDVLEFKSKAINELIECTPSSVNIIEKSFNLKAEPVR